MTYDNFPDFGNTTPGLELAANELKLLFQDVASALTKDRGATYALAPGVLPVSETAPLPYIFQLDFDPARIKDIFYQNGSELVTSATLSFIQSHRIEEDDFRTISSVALMIESDIRENTALHESFFIEDSDGILSGEVENEYVVTDGGRISPNNLPTGQGIEKDEVVGRILDDRIVRPMTLDDAEKIRELIQRTS